MWPDLPLPVSLLQGWMQSSPTSRNSWKMILHTQKHIKKVAMSNFSLFLSVNLSTSNVSQFSQVASWHMLFYPCLHKSHPWSRVPDHEEVHPSSTLASLQRGLFSLVAAMKRISISAVNALTRRGIGNLRMSIWQTHTTIFWAAPSPLNLPVTFF